MSDNRNRHKELKRTADKMYLKIIKVFTPYELEHFDICKEFIGKSIMEYEEDKRQLKMQL